MCQSVAVRRSSRHDRRPDEFLLAAADAAAAAATGAELSNCDSCKPVQAACADAVALLCVRVLVLPPAPKLLG